MKYLQGPIFLFVMVILLSSCIAKKKSTETDVMIVKVEKVPLPEPEYESYFEPYSIISYTNNDTILFMSDFKVCKGNDTILFSELGKDLLIAKECKEMALQGKAYYQVDFSKDGQFGALKVLKKIHSCFDYLLYDIHEELKQWEMVSKPGTTGAIIFTHQLITK